MNGATEVLFGEFPRRVGTPSQHWVFNEAQYDLFTSTVCGRYNAYATVGRLPVSEGSDPECNSVFYDLDSPAKSDGDWDIFNDQPDDKVVLSRMRADPDVADDVLGAVCEDARTLARASLDDNVPVIGVYSGFGLHIHQIYRRTVDPSEPMQTTAMRYIEEEDLDTPDWSVLGQPDRICRVPNMERVTKDGRGTGTFTVPLSAEELCDVSPGWLLEHSTEGRRVAPPDDDRPQMPLWEEYRGESVDSDVPQRPVDSRTLELDEGLDEMLHALLQMPCMAERLTQPNPAHEVRLNAAVLLFNVGFSPREVENLYSRLGWVDYDAETTRGHLEHIWTTRYSDMSCQTIRQKGLCVVDEPESCDCYGWSDGQAEW